MSSHRHDGHHEKIPLKRVFVVWVCAEILNFLSLDHLSLSASDELLLVLTGVEQPGGVVV